jgi:hypothetical protein
MSLYQEWMRDSKCGNDPMLLSFMREYPHLDFFHDRDTEELAKRYCAGCPVFNNCKALAMQTINPNEQSCHEAYSGVMAGTTVRERRKIRKNLDKSLSKFLARRTEQSRDDAYPSAS